MGAPVIPTWLVVAVFLLIPVLLAVAILRAVRREIPPSYTSAEVRDAMRTCGIGPVEADIVVAVLERRKELRP